MVKTVANFRAWLADQRNFLFSRFTKDTEETQEPERSLIELPASLRKKLVNDVKNLPSNPADKNAIASTLDEAYQDWRDNPNDSDNSIVILSSPVLAVSRILSETLEEWAKQKQVTLKLLPFKARPIDIKTIKSKLENALEQDLGQDQKKDIQQLEIIVIPNLSWFFLRSLDGLEGIEYLQSSLCNGSKNRFWIIGSGQVGWQYLNSVCSLEAYCGRVFTLPEIKSEDLQSWLNPIFQDLNITFDKPRIDKQILDGDKDYKTSYFDRLAKISQGVATIAVQAVLKSIKYEQRDEDEDKSLVPRLSRSEPSKSEAKSLIAQTPKLPKLPDLESADQYILYSLLLHGDLTVAALAESLGDLESEVQARVQLLRREGVVEQRDKVIKINPIHYPRVKQELAGNNFIINRG